MLSTQLAQRNVTPHVARRYFQRQSFDSTPQAAMPLLRRTDALRATAHLDHRRRLASHDHAGHVPTVGQHRVGKRNCNRCAYGAGLERTGNQTLNRRQCLMRLTPPFWGVQASPIGRRILSWLRNLRLSRFLRLRQFVVEVPAQLPHGVVPVLVLLSAEAQRARGTESRTFSHPVKEYPHAKLPRR